jgi:hypothetical protein
LKLALDVETRIRTGRERNVLARDRQALIELAHFISNTRQSSILALSSTGLKGLGK